MTKKNIKTECNYLARQGFVGTDVCLSTSLFEYGLIWKQYKRNTENTSKDEYVFYYGICENEEGIYTNYSYSYFSPDQQDIKKEFDWCSFDKVSGFIDQDIFKLDFPNQISALLSYYGRMEIFGSYS